MHLLTQPATAQPGTMIAERNDFAASPSPVNPQPRSPEQRRNDIAMRPATPQYPMPNPVAPLQSPGTPEINAERPMAMKSVKEIVERPRASNEHPLKPVLEWAEAERPRLLAIKDYKGILHKQEMIGDEFMHQAMYFLHRTDPFSVYIYITTPEEKKGTEALYIEGQNDGNLIGHAGKGIFSWAGTRSLDPEGDLARNGSKYTIREMGLLYMVDHLIGFGKHDAKYGDGCTVRAIEGAKVDGRSCTVIVVTHPKQYKEFEFHIAKIYVDDEYRLPVRCETYMWPEKPGDDPPLKEAVTYTNLEFNVGLTDADFDSRNPNYNF